MAFGLLAAACAGAGARPRSAAPAPLPLGTVALVNGFAVLTADVDARMRPHQPGEDAAALRDRRRAIDQAIRDRLFVEEAVRRGLAASGPTAALREAQLVQALIRDELARQGVSAAAVSEEEARRYFDAHPQHFGPLRSVDIHALVVDSAVLAETLLRAAERATGAEFAAAVRQHSIHAESRERGGLLGTWQEGGGISDEALHPLVTRLRKHGAAGVARGSDGLLYVLRAGAVQHAPPDPWSASTDRRARNLVALEGRERALATLEGRLRRSARVEVLDPALAR